MSGHPVVTKDGRDVRIIAIAKGVIFALVGDLEISYNIDGKLFKTHEDSDFDLYLKHEGHFWSKPDNCVVPG